MSADLDGLRAAASAATPGPWFTECAHHYPKDEQIHLVCDVLRDHYGANSISTDDHETATYIAAASPDVVLALIARVEAAEAAVARVQEICDLDAGRREVCRFDPDCTCEFKDCYECGKWHNCSHTPLTAVREALEAASDDAGSPVRPADGLSGPEAGRDGEGL